MCHPASHRRINRIINENCLCVCVCLGFSYSTQFENTYTKKDIQKRKEEDVLTHSPFTMLTSATVSASYLAGAEEDIS